MSEFKSMFQETAPESGGFSLIETGEYEAELIDCQVDLTKEPVRLSCIYQITEGVNEGRKLFGNYQLEGRGIGFLKKDLSTLGLDYSQVGSPEDIATLIWDNMPMPVIIYVAQKEWQGKMYNNVYLNELIDRPAALDKTVSKPATAQPPRQTAKPTAAKPTAAKPTSKDDFPEPPGETRDHTMRKAPKNYAPTKTGKPRRESKPIPDDMDVPF
jgi:hypothetical protein